jgi:hypothetical protein
MQTVNARRRGNLDSRDTVATRTALVVALLVSVIGACSASSATPDSRDASAAGGDQAQDAGTQASSPCETPLAGVCTAGHLQYTCVPTFDEAKQCSTWPGARAVYGVHIVESCAGYHVVHLWNVEAHQLLFYDRDSGALVAVGWADGSGLHCQGGPLRLALPWACANDGAGSSCVDDAGAD